LELELLADIAVVVAVVAAVVVLAVAVEFMY
jgi:hypothetical protein